ncbi:MAG: DUF3575 domain-containing protein [Saprospiraceae bacterium]|nr:DUF3575 domain-containing protein [Saprospiraceae bacterium]
MQFSKTLLFLVALLSAGSVFAQEKINIVKVGGSLLGIDVDYYGGAGFSIEHQLRQKTTLGFNVDYNSTSSKSADGSMQEDRETFLTIEPEFRFYKHSATQGFYVGLAPSLLLARSTLYGIVDDRLSEAFFAVALKTGYQFPITPRLHLQFGGGIGLLSTLSDIDEGILHYRVNLMLGYRI